MTALSLSQNFVKLLLDMETVLQSCVPMFAGVLYFSNNAKIGFECVYPDDEVQVHLQLGMAILLD